MVKSSTLWYNLAKLLNLSPKLDNCRQTFDICPNMIKWIANLLQLYIKFFWAPTISKNRIKLEIFSFSEVISQFLAIQNRCWVNFKQFRFDFEFKWINCQFLGNNGSILLPKVLLMHLELQSVRLNIVMKYSDWQNGIHFLKYQHFCLSYKLFSIYCLIIGGFRLLKNLVRRR